MRQWLTAAAGLLIATTLHGQALAAEADAAPNVLTFGDRAETGDRPVVLRGSAGAGQRLWFFDPETRDIRSCINQQTSTVGVRIVRCYPGTLGGYRRTFGVTFQP